MSVLPIGVWQKSSGGRSS